MAVRRKRRESGSAAGDGWASSAPARREAPDEEVLDDLVRTYDELLAAVASEARAARLPRRIWIRASMRYAVEHVRAGAGLLAQRIRAAAAADGPAAAAHDPPPRLQALLLSLPETRSRARSLGLVVAWLALAQLLLPLVDGVVNLLLASDTPSPADRARSQTAQALAAKLSRAANLNLADAGEAVRTLLHADAIVLGAVVAVAGTAGWAVLRPQAAGVLVVARVRGTPAGRRTRRLGRTRARMPADSLFAREQEILQRAGLGLPHESRLDLAAKAAGVVPWAMVGALLWRVSETGVLPVPGGGYGPDGSHAEIAFSTKGWLAGAGLTILVLAVLRSTALARELAGRAARESDLLGAHVIRAQVRPFPRAREIRAAAAAYVAPLLVLLVACLLFARGDHRRPSLELRSPALPTADETALKRLAVTFRCDEVCFFGDARLVVPRPDAGRAPGSAETLILEVEPPGAGARRGRVVIRVPDPARRRLRAGLRAARREYRAGGFPATPDLRVSVVDASDNRTSLDLPLFPALRRR